MGCVIRGDLKYGDTLAAADARIYLHARKLTFVHPVIKESVSYEAPVPPVGLWEYFLKFEKK
jgi:23S rRNA pseudouridine1911/1915/1917 synthase